MDENNRSDKVVFLWARVATEKNKIEITIFGVTSLLQCFASFVSIVSESTKAQGYHSRRFFPNSNISARVALKEGLGGCLWLYRAISDSARNRSTETNPPSGTERLIGNF